MNSFACMQNAELVFTVGEDQCATLRRINSNLGTLDTIGHQCCAAASEGAIPRRVQIEKHGMLAIEMVVPRVRVAIGRNDRTWTCTVAMRQENLAWTVAIDTQVAVEANWRKIRHLTRGAKITFCCGCSSLPQLRHHIVRGDPN